VRYVRKPGIGAYLAVLVLMALGLMAKPMLVTLPFVLLLFDVWPLNRISAESWSRSAAVRLVVEKIPFFVLVSASSFVTFLVQREGGATIDIDLLPLSMRLQNALLSYVTYISAMVWPTGLAVLYPYPESMPVWKSVGAGLLLLTATVAAATIGFRRYPYLTVGWFWFVGTLVPVIGIVQVGTQAMADRYTYIPLTGLFLIVVWGGYDLLGNSLTKRVPLLLLCLSIITALNVTTWIQSQYWLNSEALWARTLSVTTGNHRAHSKMGTVLAEKGQPGNAVQHFQDALRVRPNFAEAHNNLGNALAALGRPAEAVTHYQQALQRRSDDPTAHNGLGSALDDLGRIDEAIVQYQEAIKSDPEYTAAHNNLAAALVKKGRIDDAVTEMHNALRIDPNNALFHYNLAALLSQKGNITEALKQLETALIINPQYQQAREAISVLSNAESDGKN
jgi:tetratricopeptide (TPR) repeat protein